MDTLPVTLIVKASNQQFEDQTIKCELSWSIRKLKGYLSEVYPCNPSLEEQKLIYSGKLLNDAHILKDVLLKFEGAEDIHTHTVHLVYTPKNKNFYSQQAASKSAQKKDVKDPKQMSSTRAQPQQQQQRSQNQATSTSTGADGLRQRNVGTNATNHNGQPATQRLPFMNTMTAQPFFPGMSAFPAMPAMQGMPITQTPSQYTPEQYAFAQQMAMQNMMHQMYMQYMNHYAMQQSQSTAQGMNYSAASTLPYFPQNFGMPLPNGFNMGANANASNVYDRPTVEINQNQSQQQQQQPAPPQVQAAAARVQQNDEDAENRDWLEILYTFSRLIVLLSLVYFYSSPGRCSIVIFVMVLYYFYQSHQRNLRERQQNALEMQQAAADADVIDGENNEPAAAQPTENEVNAENSPANTESSANASEASSVEENNRLPTVTLLRTFILSFFASLIPETPAV